MSVSFSVCWVLPFSVFDGSVFSFSSPTEATGGAFASDEAFDAHASDNDDDTLDVPWVPFGPLLTGLGLAAGSASDCGLASKDRLDMNQTAAVKKMWRAHS